MSMTRLSIAIAWLLPLGPLLAGGPAYAQSDDGQPDIFFADKVSDEEQQGETPTKTLIQGSLTSSTFAYSESGGVDASAANAAQQVDNASPVIRLYTDLRAQLDAKHIKGSRWDLRVDGRIRLAPECSFRSYEAEGSLLTPELQQHVFGTCRSQSGVFGTNEYDAREGYLRRTGSKLDLYFGRQFVPELAAIKIDGIRGQYHKSDKWSYIGAGGLYPARGSRSIDTDYPLQQRMPVQLGMPVEVGPRILPVAGGAAAAYRYPRAYGALGMVGILPLADEFVSGLPEVPRIFFTDSGYLRYSSKLDLYHFAVVDLQGSGGAGLTNLSAGVNYRPVPALRVTAGYNKVDTETLNVIAQQYLDVSQTGALPGSYQNNAEVARISSQAYRLGVSAALKEQRFEISVSGQLRERPEIKLTAIDDVATLTLDAARAADIQLSVVDRRSIKGLRLGGSFLRIMGVGEVNLRRSTANIFNLNAARSFKDGKGQFEANITYLSSEDEDRGALCADVITCYGTSHVGSLSLGGTVFYRFKTDWFAVGDANLGQQTLTNVRNMVGTEQPANTLLSAFIRVAYRF